ncbi:nucleolar protein 7 [Dicentrarchus labrax]|uniref:Nucleolar protein 7 n=1 Tax=Dicentrarchus labrax TaxID=13489 RepID=A0A8P4K4Q4_DICLA|nr:nucleolar protein 7 [Dicentrarchus labrax]
MAKKQQRGETAPSSKSAGTDRRTESFSLTLASSDDEAPEEVTFEDSKSAALRSMKEALDTARREKELLKEKRRKRQELFQEQKKRKLLPTDVLEEIDSAPSKEQKQSEDEAEEEQQEAGEGEDDSRRKKKRRRSGKLPHSRNLKGNYTVTTVTERAAASFQQQTAEDFIQSRLYGAGSCRSTSNELLSLQNKKGRNKSAAVQFVRKGWASKEKAKAEKLKKRWIHKQQIPSC